MIQKEFFSDLIAIIGLVVVILFISAIAASHFEDGSAEFNQAADSIQ